jgi:hypothetical protein
MIEPYALRPDAVEEPPRDEPRVPKTGSAEGIRPEAISFLEAISHTAFSSLCRH